MLDTMDEDDGHIDHGLLGRGREHHPLHGAAVARELDELGANRIGW
jgi:hypothetical protein